MPELGLVQILNAWHRSAYDITLGLIVSKQVFLVTVKKTITRDNNYRLRCGIFGFCLLSFPQNKRKIYKLRQLSLSQFVYFLRAEPSMFTFTKESIFTPNLTPSQNWYIGKYYSDLAFFSDPCKDIEYKNFTSSTRIRTHTTQGW